MSRQDWKFVLICCVPPLATLAFIAGINFYDAWGMTEVHQSIAGLLGLSVVWPLIVKIYLAVLRTEL